MKDEGILIAIGDGGTFQVVCAVFSTDEAREMIANYEEWGPLSESNCIAPDHYEIHRRDGRGWYTRIERIELTAIGREIIVTEGALPK